MYGCGCKDWLRAGLRNGFPEAGLEGKIGEAFRPAAPCPQEPRSRWPVTDDFTGCVAETRALSPGAEQEVFPAVGAFVLLALIVGQRNFQPADVSPDSGQAHQTCRGPEGGLGRSEGAELRAPGDGPCLSSKALTGVGSPSITQEESPGKAHSP